MKCWGVNTSTVSLEKLLSPCLLEHKVDRLLFAMSFFKGRNKKRYPAPGVGTSVQKLFGALVLDKFLAYAWPGTELINHKGLVFVVKFNEAVKALMLRVQPNLNHRLHTSTPPLPEDICLFRETSPYPSLVSVTHEKQAWLISRNQPKLRGVSKSSLKPRDLIFEGKYFCRE